MSETISSPPAASGSGTTSPQTRRLWPSRHQIIREEPFFLLLAIFIGILVVGFWYAWKKGALEWD